MAPYRLCFLQAFGWLVGLQLSPPELFPAKYFISLLRPPQGKGGVMVTLILGEEIAVARRGAPTSLGWILLMLKSWGKKTPTYCLPEAAESESYCT